MVNSNTIVQSETEFLLPPLEMAIQGPKAHQVSDIDDPVKSSTTSVSTLEEEQEKVNGGDEEEYIEVEDEVEDGDDDNEQDREPDQEWSSTSSSTATTSDMRTRRTEDPLIHAVNSLQAGVDCLQLLSVILIAFAAVTLFMQLT